MEMNTEDIVRVALEASNVASICMRYALGENVKLPPKEVIEQVLVIYTEGQNTGEDRMNILEDATDVMLERLFEGDEAN